MKKEEFLTKLRKNLSVLEEGEIQDIVEEYEQHIDMKMKEGLSEEEATKDFGDLKELTAGILEAYHVKSDYNGEKKNIDFDKVKEESKKATEKATSAIGKGAGVLTKRAGLAAKWGIGQMKKLWNMIKRPFAGFRARFHDSGKRAEGRGFFSKLWLVILGFCRLIWQCIVWSIRLVWNLFWCFTGIFSGLCTLGCIFFFGIMAVLVVMGYPLVGVILITVGGGLISSSVMLFGFSLIKRKHVRQDNKDNTKDYNTNGSGSGNPEDEETDWEYPEGSPSHAKKITVNSYQEVLNHA